MGCGSSSSTAASEPMIANNTSQKAEGAPTVPTPFKGKKVTFHYFGGRGRGEFIRILLAEAGVDFVRRDIDIPDWPQFKEKEFGGNALPCLQVGNDKLFQSNTIARAIAAKAGMAGKDDWEMAQVDMMADTVQDIIDGAFAAAFLAPEEERPQKTKEFLEGKFKTTMGILDKFCSKNGTGWLAGSSITWADIKLYAILEFLALSPNTGGTNFFKSYSNISKLYHKVAALPRVAEYLKNRPETPF